MAFVTSFAPLAAPALRASSLCGARVAAAPAAGRAAVTMAASKSVPFLPAPKATEGLLGSADFDPLLLSEAFDIRWMQESEIKHGRVCMLAVVGLIVQEFVHLPAEPYSYSLSTETLKHVPIIGLVHIFLFCGVCELIGHAGKVTYSDMFTGDNKDKIPGDLGFNPMNMKFDEKLRLNEIKNGRLAMLGLSGLLHQIMIYKTMPIAGLFGLPTWPGL